MIALHIHYLREGCPNTNQHMATNKMIDRFTILGKDGQQSPLSIHSYYWFPFQTYRKKILLTGQVLHVDSKIEYHQLQGVQKLD